MPSTIEISSASAMLTASITIPCVDVCLIDSTGECISTAPVMLLSAPMIGTPTVSVNSESTLLKFSLKNVLPSNTFSITSLAFSGRSL